MIQTIKVSIPAGSSVSEYIDFRSGRLAGIEIPSASGWTAASLTFLAAHDSGSTYVPVYNEDGTEITLTVDANRFIGLGDSAAQLSSALYLKLRSGTAGSPVNQAAKREIYLHIKD